MLPVAEDPNERRARVGDLTVGLQHHDHVGSVLHERAEALLAAPEIGLDHLLLPLRVREHPDHEAHARTFEHGEPMALRLREQAPRDAEHHRALADRDAEHAEEDAGAAGLRAVVVEVVGDVEHEADREQCAPSDRVDHERDRGDLDRDPERGAARNEDLGGLRGEPRHADHTEQDPERLVGDRPELAGDDEQQADRDRHQLRRMPADARNRRRGRRASCSLPCIQLAATLPCFADAARPEAILRVGRVRTGTYRQVGGPP